MNILECRCEMSMRDEYRDENNTGIDFSKWIEQEAVTPEPLTLKTDKNNGLTFVIQDRFKYKPAPRWHECIVPFLDNATDFNGTYIINYLSTAGDFKGPYNNAKYINSKFMDYPLKNNAYYGMIYTDFPTPSLVKKIISTNFSK